MVKWDLFHYLIFPPLYISQNKQKYKQLFKQKKFLQKVTIYLFTTTFIPAEVWLRETIQRWSK